MEKFEIGKIYSYERGSGSGYDECRDCDYYLITRKTEKSIWYKRISVAVELYGKFVNEKADFNKFEEAVEKRSKIVSFDKYNTSIVLTDDEVIHNLKVYTTKLMNKLSNN